MPALHTFLRAHPEKNPFFEAILNARLGQSSYKMFLKRKLHNMSKDQGRVAGASQCQRPRAATWLTRAAVAETKAATPPASPARPSAAAAFTTSSAQSTPPDSTAPSDAQTNARLEQLKSKFKSMHPAGP